MTTKYDELRNQYIEIAVELNKDVEANDKLEKNVVKKIYSNLLKNNYEYKTLVEKIGQEKAKPRVVFMPYGSISNDRGSKQQWINSNQI
jgi:hypothetical protein